MADLKPVLRFEKLKEYFNPQNQSGRFSVFLAENLSFFLEKFLGRGVYFEAPKPDLKISPENSRLLSFFKSKNIIENFGFGQNYPDEPRSFQFSVHTKGIGGKAKGDWCGGHSLANLNEAVSKAISEAVERYSLYVWSEKNLVFGPYSELKSSGAVDPAIFAGVADRKINDENSIFGWTQARDFLSGQKVFVPAQLVYLTYPKANEPVIYHTNTTGAACGRSFEEAAYRGLCEAIERDAWMITYFNKLSPPVVDLSDISKFKNPELIKLLNLFKRYNLEVYAVDMTTDIKIPTILGIVRDENSPAKIAFGAKTCLDPEEAILGALMEAQRIRLAVRRMFDEKSSGERKEDLLYRAYLWNLPGKIKDLAFLWSGPTQNVEISIFRNLEILKSRNAEISAKEKLNKVLDELKNNNCNVFAKDVTIPEAKKLGFCVVKTLVPQLQPMHLHDAQPFLSGKRLYNVPVKLGYFENPKTIEELNKLPHPFA